MDNPVDFVDATEWRMADAARRLLDRLKSLGFRDSAEHCEIKPMSLRASALAHDDQVHYAIVFEDDTCPPWCEVGSWVKRCSLGGDLWGARYFIATGAVEEREWRYASKAITRIPEADPAALFEHAVAMRNDLVAEQKYPELLTITLHDRMWEQWQFLDKERDPRKLAAQSREDSKRLRKWVSAFTKHFRPLGFLTSTADLKPGELTKMIMGYDEPLFEHCPGVLAVVDDYDAFPDFFSYEELASLPETTQSSDLRVLASLDPDRVWWSFRIRHDGIADERDRRLAADVFIASLNDISIGRVKLAFESEKALGDNRSEVALTVDSSKHTIECHYSSGQQLGIDDNMMAPDPAFLGRINDVIELPGVRFEHFVFADADDEYDHHYIALLDLKARAALERKRGWVF